METITVEIGKEVVADVARVEDAIATKFDWEELVEGTKIMKKVEVVTTEDDMDAYERDGVWYKIELQDIAKDEIVAEKDQQEVSAMVANPETKTMFMKKIFQKKLKGMILEIERDAIYKEANVTVKDLTETDIQLS